MTFRLVLYKSPVQKKNYQYLVKTTSFERHFSKRGASFFGGGGDKILNLQGRNLFRGQAGSGGAPLPPCEKKASGVDTTLPRYLKNIKEKKERVHALLNHYFKNIFLHFVETYLKF